MRNKYARIICLSWKNEPRIRIKKNMDPKVERIECRKMDKLDSDIYII